MKNEVFNQVYNSIITNSFNELNYAKKETEKEKYFRILLGVLPFVIISVIFAIVYYIMLFVVEGELIEYGYFILFAISLIILSIFTKLKNKMVVKSNDFINLYLEKVVLPLINTIDKNISLNKHKTFTKEIYDIGKFEKYNRYSSKILFEGLYNRLPFQFTWVKIEYRSHSHSAIQYHTIFNGLVLKIDLRHTFHNFSVIRKSSRLDNYFMKSIIQIDVPEFMKKYYIFSDNEILTKQILNTDVIHKILELNNRYQSMFDFTVRDNNLFIRILDSAFDPNNFNKEEIYRCYNSILFMFEVLDYLMNLLNRE